MYVIDEMVSSITAFSYSAAGTFTWLQTVSTLPPDFSGTSSTAEIIVHQSGKFVYGSNRGHDSIAIFTVDGDTGKLTAAGHQPSGGKNPRNFALDPSGTWMFVGNQESNSLVTFRVNANDGSLTQVFGPMNQPTPYVHVVLPLP